MSESVEDVAEAERNTNKKRRASRSTRQQWSRGRQEDFLRYKTGLALEHISEAHSSQTCPKCNARTKVRGRDYVCRNTSCGFRSHRDAVGGVNIHALAVNDGTFVPDPDLRVEVMYRRAQPGWSQLQRTLHAYHQDVFGCSGTGACREARPSAQNRATRSITAAGVAVPSARTSDDTTTHQGADRTPVHVA